jgi:anaerobic sulfite reductase subunit C
MDNQKLELAALKRIGIIQQRQKNLFAMRLHVVGGDLTAEQLHKIADVAVHYGRGTVHLSTRQGVEIHDVPYETVQKAREELASANIQMGACGTRIRIIVACPGSATCRWGLIETKEIAHNLDRRYFRKETPHKFKLAVTGCPNNCAKATENDVGVMGGVLPRWNKESCIGCNLCIPSCPTDAICRDGDSFMLKREACILCGICIGVCPTFSWAADQKGYTLFVGGTMGKRPRLGTKIKELIGEKKELYTLIDRTVACYRKNGKARERFGHTMDRLGSDEVKGEILHV